MQQNKSLFVLIMAMLLLGLVLLSSSVALAGGWAVVTLDALPARVVAEQPITIGFMVRQHGHTPMENLTPYIKATQLESGKSLYIAAQTEGDVGHYVATLTFPQVGIWRWSIEAFTADQPMPPLEVQAAGPAVPEKAEPVLAWPLFMSLLGMVGAGGTALVWRQKRTWWAVTSIFVSLGITGAGLALTTLQMDGATPAAAATPGQIELGRDLFIAKGCTTCHAHSAIREWPNIFIGEGPDLTNYPTTAEYLRIWLKDPLAIKPNTKMPNLELKETEIEALIAFLLNSETEGQMAQADMPPVESEAAQARSQTDAPFFVRPQGAKGPLVIYRMPAGRDQIILPPGMFSADRTYYYAATVQQDHTLLSLFLPATGQLERNFTLNGHWSLSGVSPSGQWLALTRIFTEEEKAAWRKEGEWQTEIKIVKAMSGEVIHTVALEGNFEVETISSGGDSLFLIEHLPAVNPSQYLVRLYDLSAEKLQPGALRAKGVNDEVMTGLAWGGLASPDGRWLLTLYLNTQRDMAFIHALDLANKTPFCIDLPSGEGDLAKLKHYALALAPDGQTVYATNTVLGVVAEVSLERYQVVQQIGFPAGAPLAEAGAETDIPTNYSLLSKDGQKLYFSSGRDVWSFDTKAKEMSGPYLSEVSIRGLGLSPDEQQLYAAIEGQSPQVIDLAAVSVKITFW